LYQKSIKKSIEYKGTGILFGKESKLTLRPAPAGAGIVFNDTLKVCTKNAFFDKHSLGITNGKAKIYFIEHLLAACYNFGVNNLFIDVTGKEIPFGDGSSLPWVELITSTGLKTYREKRNNCFLPIPIIVCENDSFLLALPGKKLSINCFVDFPQTRIGAQFWGGPIDQTTIIKELAPARTFGTYQNGKFLKKLLPFELVTEGNLILPKKARYKNEAVRHKVLDLLGHLSLLDYLLNAKIFAFKPSHKLNQKFIRRLEAIYEDR
jgi:UDP-3-O-[3-hydroxymyristoyl] N-acetylglucosamine deacetylase